MSELKHVCPERNCEARFARPSKLQVHLRKHTCERPFECKEENCNKSYTNESHLRRHIKRSHQKDNNEVFKCDIEGCVSRFINADNLKRHKNNIHFKKDYVCNICNEGFHKKCKLRAHMTEHTGEFKCNLCNALFKTFLQFKRHKNEHKTYTCSCGEVFYKWTVYLQHRRTSHAQKHICDICKKELTTKVILKAHKKTHEESRTVFHCSFENCERLYYYKMNLSEHIKSFHMGIKRPLPPSKLKLKNSTTVRKAPKTLATGRKRRKDIKSMRKSSALAIVGLNAPYEAEKALVAGKQIEGELSEDNSDVLDISDYSDVELSLRVLRKHNNTSDSDSSTARMIAVH